MRTGWHQIRQPKSVPIIPVIHSKSTAFFAGATRATMKTSSLSKRWKEPGNRRIPMQKPPNDGGVVDPSGPVTILKMAKGGRDELSKAEAKAKADAGSKSPPGRQ